ncbi:histidinol-phosphate transaminase [Xanthomonadaceae bacterium XH05]|nr:histidinol-phosphate transaminase [Xanthomonadaceae bacterium XH05]
MSVLDLVRPDLRAFAGYSSARRTGASGRVWLNANESPWPSPADAGARCNRYPSPQPEALRVALAALYGVTPEQLLIGRGSDEAIDLLVRASCRPERDAVVISPPVFGMYAVSARLQNAPLIEVPLRDVAAGFTADLDAIARAAEQQGARLVFLCSPGNPTGDVIALDDIAALAARLEGQAIVVVDEAYGEFSDLPSVTTLLQEHANLAVLRTLSKAHALAAARIGTLISAPELIAVLRNCQAPYPLPTPCVDLALAALAPDVLEETHRRITVARAERARLSAALAARPGVRRVYPSQGNFLLVRFEDAQRAFDRLLAAGVVVRDQRAALQLHDALRISVGSPEENDAVIAALSNNKDATA